MASRFGALNRPRHLLATLAVFLLLGGAGGALVGLAAADDTATPAVALPVPHKGDAGVYELRKAPLDDDARYRGFEEDRDLRLAFAFGGQQVHYDSDGKGHQTHRLEVNRVQDGVHGNATVFVDAGARTVIAQVSEWVDEQEPRQGGGLLPTEETGYVVWRTTTFHSFQALPCGLLDSFQGEVLRPGSYQPFTETCQWGAGDHDPNGHWRRIRGVTEDGEGLLVVDYTTLHPDDRPNRWTRADWRAWYSPDSPYPVRMEDLIGGSFGAPGDVLELTHFTRGTVPLATGGPTPPDLAPLRLAARTPWLLDDTGAGHPWPLSAAYRYALSDPTNDGLRTFMANHPDAYMAHAGHAAFDMDGRHTERWSFTVTDGDARHGVAIAQDRAARTLLPGVPIGAPETTYRYEDPWTAPVEDRILPPSARVPTSFPTAASLLAQWEQAMAGTGNPDASPSWSFLVTCDDASCQNVTTQLGAGQTYYYREAEPGYPLIDNRFDAWDTSDLSWTNGLLTHGSESFQAYTRDTPTPLDLADERTPESDEAYAAAPLQSIWSWPSPAQAAGVGLAAFFGALLYYLWPIVKAGGAGLFTRVHTDALLDHRERRAIHDALRAEPGLHYNELRRRVGLGNGALQHHLHLLEKGGRLTSARSAGYTCYYVKGEIDRRVMAALPALRSDGAKRILQAVMDNPGIPGAEAAAAAGLTPQTGHYHIQRLRAAGLIDARRDGRAVRLHPTDVAARVPATGSAGA